MYLPIKKPKLIYTVLYSFIFAKNKSQYMKYSFFRSSVLKVFFTEVELFHLGQECRSIVKLFQIFYLTR